MDLDGDGRVTLEEFRQGHAAMFSATDSDGDGVLDADQGNAQRDDAAEKRAMWCRE